MRFTMLSAGVALSSVAGLASLAGATPATVNDPSKITSGFIYEAIATASASELASFSAGMNASLGVGVTGGATPREILSLVKYDLTGLSLNPATEKATLTLTNIGTSFIVPPASNVTDPTPAQPVTVGLKPVTSAWSYSTVSYTAGASIFPPNNVNAGQPSYGPVLLEQHNVTGTSQTLTYDVTGLVTGWLAAPATNNGVALVQTAAPDFITGQGWAVANFSSSRGASVPVLSIVPIPEPTTLTAFAGATALLARRRRVAKA